MTCRWRSLNSSRQMSHRFTCQRRRIWPRSSCSRPRLPIIVPRSVTATISPDGVTRFCLGIVKSPPRRTRGGSSLVVGGGPRDEAVLAEGEDLAGPDTPDPDVAD